MASFASAATAQLSSHNERLLPRRHGYGRSGAALPRPFRTPSTPPIPTTTLLRASRRAGSASSDESGGAAVFLDAPSTPSGAKTRGWGKRRGAIPPDSELLNDPETHGYCVYSHADWAHAYKSVEGEFDYDIARDEVEGRIPDALRGGVLYRAGPGLFERGGVEYNHMLDGDGYSLRFEFSNDGAAMFRSRFVRTEEFKAEEDADAVVYRGTFGTMRDGGWTANAFDLHQKNLANTNILAWGGKVYALYEAGRPVELDPVNLDTMGEVDMNGKLSPGMFISTGAPAAVESVLGLGGKAFTAHPHADPHTGRMVGWGWKSLVARRAVEVTFWEWDQEWKERGETAHLLTGCEVRRLISYCIALYCICIGYYCT